jgi:hypothetical protein
MDNITTMLVDKSSVWFGSREGDLKWAVEMNELERKLIEALWRRRE